MFVPISLYVTSAGVLKGVVSAFSSVFGSSTPHKALSDYDTIEGTTAIELYGGDSGSPVICRNSSNRLTLNGLLRGGGRGEYGSHVIMQDIYFDNWVIEHKD